MLLVLLLLTVISTQRHYMMTVNCCIVVGVVCLLLRLFPLILWVVAVTFILISVVPWARSPVPVCVEVGPSPVALPAVELAFISVQTHDQNSPKVKG